MKNNQGREGILLNQCHGRRPNRDYYLELKSWKKYLETFSRVFIQLK